LERKLAAILCADVHGYSRLMEENEEATLSSLSASRKIIDGLIEQHRGRFVGSAGDSVIAEFASVVNAVQCAVEIQSALKAENASLPLNRHMQFRVGVNLGDVMVEGEQIYGDGVNVAARLESLAEPGGICISGMVHDQVRDKLVLTYKDAGEQAVKNIARPVHVWRVLPEGTPAARRIPRRYWRSGALSLTGLVIIIAMVLLVQHLSLKPPRTSASIPPPEKPSLPLPSIPSIAVLPFVNLSGDAQQDYFSDGMTDDLVVALSRFRGFFVIDRSSTFAYKGKPARIQQVGRELGVKYVVEGSARKTANRVRINVELADATTGKQIWGEQYDRQLRDIFSLQDEIVADVIATVEAQIPLLEHGMFFPQRTKNLRAYDYFLRAFEYFLTPTPEGYAKARKMLEKAIELDPSYADAYGLLSISYFVGYVWQWDQDLGAIDRAAELAEKAVVLDDSNSTAYALLGWTAAYKQQIERAVTNGKRAVSLGPNDAFAWSALSEIMQIAGNPHEGLADAQKAMRLDPRHPEAYFDEEGHNYLVLGLFGKAVAAFKVGDPTNPWTHVGLAYAYSELGRERDAQTEAAEVMRRSPHFSLEEVKQRIPSNWDDPWHQHYLAELRKAGLK
jgi:adenylate cyclase